MRWIYGESARGLTRKSGRFAHRSIKTTNVTAVVAPEARIPWLRRASEGDRPDTRARACGNHPSAQ